ncbi:MAG: tyrosine-type recombinase/integrase [Deltaproteobacteria bacterium]|nr:tyrosine-type recombinase/integrase [Deltaproteobacteria bacterium]
MPLTDIAIRNAKPRAKPYKLSDSGGLFVLVTPAGGKLWRYKYRFGGKEKSLSLGAYPELALASARVLHFEARQQLNQGIDPSAVKQGAKARLQQSVENSFNAIYQEWQESRVGVIQQAQIDKSRSRIEKDVLPWLGNKPVSEITASDVLTVLRRIDGRGVRYTAHRVKSEISCVIRYAIVTGRAERDPCQDLRGALPPARETHRAALVSPQELKQLLLAIDAFKGTFVVLCALRLLPLIFCRPGELRTMKWVDIDLDRATWRYTVSKTNTDHLVPLSNQAVAILKELSMLTGNREHVFPGGRDPRRPMSDAAVNAALRRLGYDTSKEMTAHGFRATARTILHEELGFAPEVIEHQLAHKVPDTLGAAYNRTKFIKQRTEMMQRWADYLDALKLEKSNVISINRSA